MLGESHTPLAGEVYWGPQGGEKMSPPPPCLWGAPGESTDGIPCGNSAERSEDDAAEEEEEEEEEEVAAGIPQAGGHERGA